MSLCGRRRHAVVYQPYNRLPRGGVVHMPTPPQELPLLCAAFFFDVLHRNVKPLCNMMNTLKCYLIPNPFANASQDAQGNPSGSVAYQFVELEDWAQWRSLMRDSAGDRRPGYCVVVDLDRFEAGSPAEEIIATVPRESRVILLSSQADLTMARHVFSLGVFDFLSKPIEPFDLLRSIGRAMTQIQSFQKSGGGEEAFARAFEALTPREGEYLTYLLEGWSIKTLANHFRVSVQTAAKHRARVLRKLNAENEVELVHRFGRRMPPA